MDGRRPLLDMLVRNLGALKSAVLREILVDLLLGEFSVGVHREEAASGHFRRRHRRTCALLAAGDRKAAHAVQDKPGPKAGPVECDCLVVRAFRVRIDGNDRGIPRRKAVRDIALVHRDGIVAAHDDGGPAVPDVHKDIRILHRKAPPLDIVGDRAQAVRLAVIQQGRPALRHLAGEKYNRRAGCRRNFHPAVPLGHGRPAAVVDLTELPDPGHAGGHVAGVLVGQLPAAGDAHLRVERLADRVLP